MILRVNVDYVFFSMNSTNKFTLNCYTTTVLQYGKKISLHFLSLSNKSVSPDDLLLRMGEYDLGSTDEPQGHVDRKVQIVASHPKFDPKTFEYDLALLRFYEPVEFAPNVIPICIPEEDQDLVGETAWVTGWGRLYEGKVQLF